MQVCNEENKVHVRSREQEGTNMVIRQSARVNAVILRVATLRTNYEV